MISLLCFFNINESPAKNSPERLDYCCCAALAGIRPTCQSGISASPGGGRNQPGGALQGNRHACQQAAVACVFRRCKSAGLLPAERSRSLETLPKAQGKCE